MRHPALALCAGLLLLGLVPGSTLAVAPVEDQSNNPVPMPGYAAGGAVQYAQTFTVGIKGKLDYVDLFLCATHEIGVGVDIYDLTASGMPGSALMAYGAAYVDTTLLGWYQFPLSNQWAVVPGDKYAIVFDPEPPWV